MDEGALLENLSGVVLGVVLVGAQVLEAYNMLNPLAKPIASKISQWGSALISFPSRIIQISHDFRNRKFYKPWGRITTVIIRNPEHFQELSEAPQLSQRAIYADIFGFKYTMTHNNIDMDPNEQTAARYRLYNRAIKIIGIPQLASLQPFLQSRLEQTIEAAMVEAKKKPIIEGWTTLELAPLMSDAASGMLGVYFFGDVLTKEPGFSSALRRYYQDVMRSMGIMQIFPDFLRSPAYNLATQNRKALNVLFERLNKVIESLETWEENKTLKSVTLFYNFIEGSKDSLYWTNDGLIQAIIGTWFAASHQPWINLHFVFLELCQRPEYVDLIREEIDQQESLDYDGLCKLQILDSFIKETARVNPLDKMSIRRKALKPYNFSHGGPRVALGEIACVASWDIMHDETKFPEPDSFDGLRFVKDPPSSVPHQKQHPARNSEMKGTLFTDASKEFPIWGLGSKVCPGRWHADFVIKLALVHFLIRYDFRLEAPDAPHRWFWESWQMPYYSTKVSFRERVR